MKFLSLDGLTQYHNKILEKINKIKEELENRIANATNLDGLTATVDELNCCDGVTSNIQDQLNNKSDSSHNHTYVDAARNAYSPTFIIPNNGDDNVEGGELEIKNQDGTVWCVDSWTNNFRIIDSNGSVVLNFNRDDPESNYVICNTTSANNADKLDGFHISDLFSTIKGSITTLFTPTEEGTWYVTNADSTFPYPYGLLEIRYGSHSGEYTATYKTTGNDFKIYYNGWRNGWVGWKEAINNTNADTVDGVHAWQMQTLDNNGNPHGSSAWLMQVRHNIDSDGYFKLICGDGSVGTKVDKANSSNSATSASASQALASTGFGNTNFTYCQTSDDFY